MSWQDAKKRALTWLQDMKLPEDLNGQSLDMDALAEKLKHESTAFRKMVIRAAKRELRRRGAKIT